MEMCGFAAVQHITYNEARKCLKILFCVQYVCIQLVHIYLPDTGTIIIILAADQIIYSYKVTVI